jgi:hypothetical protein
MLMFSLSTTSKYIYTDEPRPNIFAFYVKRLPSAFVFTTGSLLPPLAVALPGVALAASHPIYSAAWCGVGFPVLSVILRFIFMSYMADHADKRVKSKRMTPEGVFPHLSTVSFNVAVSLMLGNSMLLYDSKNAKFAAVSAALAILTEVISKMYTAWLIVNQRNLREQANRVTRRLSLSNLNEATENKKQEQQEQLTMFAMRLSNEIIAEKVCILVAAIVNAFFIPSQPHSIGTIAQFSLIFFIFESIADVLLVFTLDKYFDVPVLRLPREKFKWMSVAEISIVPVITTCFFLHAYLVASKWINAPDNNDPMHID